MLLRRRLSELPQNRLRAVGTSLAGLGVVMTVVSPLKLGMSDFSQGFLVGFALVLLAASAFLVIYKLPRSKA